ncbi:MAG TPA: PilZ domain-containing protein [Blastocatellia bacterium]|nr:PilZ domain-containing protein [Blastocatellia bacterium]
MIGTPEAQSAPAGPDFTAEQISTYYLELERLLERVEVGVTHYQALSVERTATYEEIRLTYHQAIALLYPAYKLGATVPSEMVARIERAFTKISRAFAVLANYQNRLSYDGALGKSPAAVARPEQPIAIANRPAVQKVHSGFSAAASNDNRRRCERFRLSIPARLTGFDKKAGKWNEMAETVDVSRTGVNLRMRRHVRHGNVLYVTLPLPQKLRSHGYAEPSYNAYALVRRVDPPRNGLRLVGLEFIGEHPPMGYLDKPWASFQTRKWGGANRRRRDRREQVEIVVIEYFDESMKLVAKEMGRTENISRGGMRVCVRTPPPEFDTIRVSCHARGFESFAAVSNRYVGKDGFDRLCLKFLNGEWSFS